MHASHAVLPAAAWNVPASQSEHVGCLSLGVYVPGAHCVGSVTPVPQAARANEALAATEVIEPTEGLPGGPLPPLLLEPSKDNFNRDIPLSAAGFDTMDMAEDHAVKWLCDHVLDGADDFDQMLSDLTADQFADFAKEINPDSNRQ